MLTIYLIRTIKKDNVLKNIIFFYEADINLSSLIHKFSDNLIDQEITDIFKLYIEIINQIK